MMAYVRTIKQTPEELLLIGSCRWSGQLRMIKWYCKIFKWQPSDRPIYHVAEPID